MDDESTRHVGIRVRRLHERRRGGGSRARRRERGATQKKTPRVPRGFWRANERVFARVLRLVGGFRRPKRREVFARFLRAARYAHDRRRDALLPRAGGDHEQREIHRGDGRLGAGVHLRRAPAAATAARVDPQPDHLAAVPVRRRPRPEARHVGDVHRGRSSRGRRGERRRRVPAERGRRRRRRRARERRLAKRNPHEGTPGSVLQRHRDAVVARHRRHPKPAVAAVPARRARARGEHHQAVCGLRRELARPVAPHAGIRPRTPRDPARNPRARVLQGGGGFRFRRRRGAARRASRHERRGL